MILKVQKPIMSTDHRPSYLIYDESREVELMIPVGEDDALDNAMRDRLKAFFHAEVDECGIVAIINCSAEVEDPGW